jgi:hypothetical protein
VTWLSSQQIHAKFWPPYPSVVIPPVCAILPIIAWAAGSQEASRRRDADQMIGMALLCAEPTPEEAMKNWKDP